MAGRRIRVFRSPDNNQWYFHVQAGNGEIVSTSEGYKDKRDLEDTVNEYFPDYEVVEEAPESQ